MSFAFSIGPIVALIAGILILIIPRLLNYIIAVYLIVIGILGLVGDGPRTIGAHATDLPPAAVQQVSPATTGPSVSI
jgi:Protein of unknown function (DUF3096)